VPLGPDVDLTVLARGTPGFSGADLENLVNEAALAAARVEKTMVAMQDFDKAKDKVLMGAERRSLVLSEEEKRNTAYHEAGHTVVAKGLPNADPVYKVSIIPRGWALGVTMSLPTDEKYSRTREFFLDDIAMRLGGRAAEELVLGHMTTGATNDIETATDFARKMVCKWGMSERLGPLSFGKEEEQIFLGREISTHKNYSEKTAVAIDEEVTALVVSGLSRAKEILVANREKVEYLAEALLQRETLVGDEIDQIMRGEKLVDLVAPEPPADPDARQPELDFGPSRK
jgi:cell division protease FtsH